MVAVRHKHHKLTETLVKSDLYQFAMSITYLMYTGEWLGQAVGFPSRQSPTSADTHLGSSAYLRKLRLIELEAEVDLLNCGRTLADGVEGARVAVVDKVG